MVDALQSRGKFRYYQPRHWLLGGKAWEVTLSNKDMTARDVPMKVNIEPLGFKERLKEIAYTKFRLPA